MPSRKLALGPWPAVSLDVARAAARTKAGQVASGGDPAVDRRTEKVRARNVLGKVLDVYQASLKRRHIVNVATIMSTLRRGLAPLLSREIADIRRQDLVSLIDGLEGGGKPGAAQDLRKNARTLFEFAVAKGIAPFNPLAGMRRPRASRVERLEDGRKGRALSDAEVGTLWASAASLGSFGGLIRFALLTALRRSELSGLKWSDIHNDRVAIEAEHAKTGARHEVPLTTAMRAVLGAQPTTGGFVFLVAAASGWMVGRSWFHGRASKAAWISPCMICAARAEL